MAHPAFLCLLPLGLLLGGLGVAVLAVVRRLRVRERAARAAARGALDDRAHFLAAVTHDLQQPLYALRLATDVLGRQALQGPGAEALGQMRAALHAADELVTAMLMAARLDGGAPAPRPQVFPVQPMLERLEALFAAQARHKRLSWRVPPSAAWVHSDPALLERMLGNLVSNALRYTDRGGVLLACRERGGTLLIQVWDTGRGMGADERHAVFQAHRRGSAARRGDRGMGLGLSIVARCARWLRVGVSLRSVPGRGTCFELRVPRAPAPPPPPSA